MPKSGVRIGIVITGIARDPRYNTGTRDGFGKLYAERSDIYWTRMP